MRLEKEFVIAQPREVCSKALEDDATYTSLFPDTEITSSSGGVRETLTHYSASRRSATATSGALSRVSCGSSPSGSPRPGWCCPWRGARARSCPS
jgi:hypothetical protein